MNFNKLVDKLYRKPRSDYRKIMRFGGFLKYNTMMRNQVRMMKAAAQLPPISSAENGLKIYFLTGRNYLYQTLFCIYSLSRCSAEKFSYVLVDDGSFTANDLSLIEEKLPGCIVVDRKTIKKNLEDALPQEQYPYLNHKRSVYPHIKKLTDVHTHAAHEPWKLVIDSDMIFWNEPLEMISWLKDPIGNMYMIDSDESYGFSTEDMERLCGSPIPPKLNVGIIGLNSSEINWADLERWAKELEVNGASYYLEQALSAMLAAGKPATVLAAQRYIVNPGQLEIINKEGALHHYVDLSKEGYFNIAWKSFLP